MSGQNSASDFTGAIGITIGSVYSSVAIIDKDGRANVIANEDGERMIPTCVAFRNGQIFSGTAAHNQSVRNSENTLYGFFELLGQPLDSEIVKFYQESYPFKITEKGGKVSYEVTIEDSPATYSAQEIAVHYLTMIKEVAEAFIGSSVTGVVISVPQTFTDAQKSELKDAASKVGLKVEQIANEPSLALLAYDYLDRDIATDKSVVVFDLGGRSLDVTLMSAKQGIYTIIASHSDREVSGLLLDNVLVQYFAKEFKTKNKVDISDNKRALAKLRIACELTKKTLSSITNAPCSVESLAEGIDYHANVNRLRFELMSKNYFNKAISNVENLLESAGYHTNDIEEVILIGGGSRIPKVQTLLRHLFPETTSIRSDIDVDEAVSRGGVMQASLLQSLHETEDVSLEKLASEANLASANHISAPIGVVAADGTFVTLVKSDTPLPLRRVFRFESSKDQDSAYIVLHQGEKEAVTVQPEVIPGEDGEEDEIPEPITTYRFKPAAVLAELGLTGLDSSTAKVELQLQLDEDSKITAILRDLSSGQIVKVGA